MMKMLSAAALNAGWSSCFDKPKQEKIMGLISIDTGNGTNLFTGDQIESLKPESDLLADYWILTLKDGRVFRLGLDWRGADCYIGLYQPDAPIKELRQIKYPGNYQLPKNFEQMKDKDTEKKNNELDDKEA